jgi:hypothetical protein
MNVLIDPEFARICVAIGETAQLLVYVTAQHMTRTSSGSGSVDTRELVDALHGAGVKATAGTIRRWILRGAGAYWHLRVKRLYLFGMARLTSRGERGRLNITQRAIDALKPEIVMTNPSGANLIEIEVPPTLRQFTAQVYRAWFASRADHTQLISRYTLCTLWNVTRKTLQGWEKLAHIQPVESYVHYQEARFVPEHRDPYLISKDTAHVPPRYKARYSNAYNAPTLRELPRTRSDQQRRQSALRLIQTDDGSFPTNVFGVEVTLHYLGGFKVTGRLTFDDSQGEVAALKRIRKHLQHHQDYATPHYIRKGFNRRGQIILEQTNGATLVTEIDEQLPRQVADPVFAKIGGRAAWRAA